MSKRNKGLVSPPQPIYKSIDTTEIISNGIISIGVLRNELDRLAHKHSGDKTLLEFDAGANNICVDVVEELPPVVPPKKPLTKEQRLVQAAQKVRAQTYLDDDVLNRHGHTTVSCEALKELFEAAGIKR